MEFRKEENPMKMTNIEENSMKGYKVRLYPNKKQRKLFFEYFEMSRFVYNKCIDIQEEQYMKYFLDEDRKKRLSYETLTGIFIKMKKEDKYNWLNNYSVDSIKGAIRDCCKAYSN